MNRIFKLKSTLLINCILYGLFIAPSSEAFALSCRKYLEDGPINMSEIRVEVQSSRDAGAYHCEHVALTIQHFAEYGRSIKRDETGDYLVGFLHFPEKAQHWYEDGHAPSPHELQEASLVVASGLRGYLDQLMPRSQEEYKILMSGFGPFGEVTNNPTQHFLENTANLERVLRIATNAPVDRLHEGKNDDLVYQVVINGKQIKLVLSRKILPVNDDIYNRGEDDSLEDHLISFQPDAVLSMGSGTHSAFEVETLWSDIDLELNESRLMHFEPEEINETMAFVNNALLRAISFGSGSISPRQGKLSFQDVNW